MRQKREIIISVGVADDIENETDCDRLAADIHGYLREILGEEKLLFVEYCDDEWGEPDY